MSNNRNNRTKPRGLAGFSEVARPIEKFDNQNEGSEVKEDVKETVVNHNTPPVEPPKEVQDTQATTETAGDQDFSNEKADEKPLQIDDIVSSITATPKQPKKRQVNFYIDEDVIKELEKFNKKHGKGAKSNLVNEFLRKAFKM